MGGDLLRADLHLHSRYSDGSSDISDLIHYAQLSHVAAVAITDHDTLAGQEEAAFYGEKYGVEVIPGVELSGFDYKRRQKSHVLCYYPENPEALQAHCKWMTQHRNDVADKMIEKVVQMYPVNREMIMKRAAESESVFKQHIMHALIDAGCAKKFFGETYKYLFAHATGKANVPITYPDVYDILKAAREANGIIVIAHPGESRKKGLLVELAEQGLVDGVELYCPKNDAEEIDRVSEIARKYDLLITGGTDFHGMYSNRRYPVGTFTISMQHLTKLKELAARKRSENTPG